MNNHPKLLSENQSYRHHHLPPTWIAKRWRSLQHLEDNPIVILAKARANRRLIQIDPFHYILPILAAVLLISLIYFLNIAGVVLFAIGIKLLMARLPRRHLIRRLFGIDGKPLLQDLVQTPMPVEDIVWGALSPKLSIARIRRLGAQAGLALAGVVTLSMIAGAPPIILFTFVLMGGAAFGLYVFRLDSIEIHFLRQLTITLWTHRAGNKRDFASMFAQSAVFSLVWFVAWLILTIPCFLLMEFITIEHIGVASSRWTGIAALALSLLSLFNIFVFITYQNENYNVRELALLYDDVLRSEAGAELNRNLDWIPVPVEDQQDDELDALGLRS